MRKHSILFFFGSILVAFATFFVLTAQEPEMMHVVSDDGHVSVTGYARASLPFLIRNIEATPGAPLRGDVYHLQPDTLTLEQPATVHFSLDNLSSTENSMLYQYDPAFRMWAPVQLSRHEDMFMEAPVDHLGRFALGDSLEVASPAFLTTFDAIRTHAPVQAVGYQIAVGIRLAAEGSPTIQLPHQTETGGCGGVVRAGEHEEYSEVVQQARVLINDVETDATFLFRARWFIDGVGCPQGEFLSAFGNVIQ